MSDRSAIEWTDASWTPIRARNLKTGKIGWHCVHKSTGCEFCYAEAFNLRLGTGLPFKPGHEKDIEIFLDEKTLTAPLRWRRPRRIFVCSMTDLFADFVKDERIDRVFAVMALKPEHTFQVLTKRPERMRNYVSSKTIGGPDRISRHLLKIAEECGRDHRGKLSRWPLTNVWLGVSAERQEEADERIPILLQTPAAVRFVSLEPLLGPIDLTELYPDRDSENATHALAGIRANPDGTASFGRGLDWVIVGGESGSYARACLPEWARSLRDQCAASGVPFFFKQWGQHRPPTENDRAWRSLGKKASGRLLDGVKHDGFPEVRS